MRECPNLVESIGWHISCNIYFYMAQPIHLESACEHCGAIFIPTTTQRFCCAGCKFVYELIQSEGLEHYYQIKDATPPACPLPVQLSTSTYDYCDDLEFIKKLSPDGLRLRFYLEGLNCTACLWLLEKLPDFCVDADLARVDMATSTIEVRRKPGASFAVIAQTLNRFGYRPHPLRESETSSQHQIRERRGDLIRIGVAGALTGNIMILAVSLYGGATGSLAEQFRWLSGVLAVPVLTYGAWPFYRSTFLSLRSRWLVPVHGPTHLNLDVPIVVAIVAGIVTSIWGLFIPKGNVYFDSLCMLVFLLLSSRFVLKGIQTRQLSSTNLEDEILLGTVQRLNTHGQIEKVSSLALVQGDIIRIDRECFIPVDGVVESGSGAINAAVLTGESEPVQVTQGLKVEAGSQNLLGEWFLSVTKLPGQTRLAQILRDTERSAQSKSTFVHFTDHVSNWFIATVLTCAAALVFYFLGSDLHEGVSRALALVIVTCPCVFGIAIPLSMSFAIRGAARKGIIVKNADAIERLWDVKALFFDKTGTLTTGEMSVLNLKYDFKADLKIALGLEKNQSHPVARAIVKHLLELGISECPLENIQILSEGGVRGNRLGNTYSVVPLNSDANENSAAFIRSSYGLFQDQQLLATFELGDQPRDEAANLLFWARKNNYLTRMISGDRKHVVEACARKLGFSKAEIQWEVSPEDKALEIRNCRETTAMIGDGANDASAIAAASVGIALCGSLDVSLRAADIYLTRPNLKAIVDLFEIAKSTKKAIRRNLIFSASFNIVSGVLAASGMMTPLWAAVLMPVSSLTIVLSSAWTGRKLSQEGNVT